MSSAAITDGSTVLTPDERRLLDKVRKLPPEAIPQIEEYLLLLTARFTNPGRPDASTPEHAAKVLATEGFQKVVRRLSPEAAELLLEAATFIAGRHLQWNYDDPSSLELSTELMAIDPFMCRVNEEINREFSVCEGDGLENY